jgi:ATP-dependent exoDNAse (exonuclease V) beta subunit
MNVYTHPFRIQNSENQTVAAVEATMAAARAFEHVLVDEYQDTSPTDI